jgi:hypothetical protein
LLRSQKSATRLAVKAYRYAKVVRDRAADPHARYPVESVKQEVLIPEVHLARQDEHIRQWIANSGLEYPVDVEDPDYGPALRRYLAFSSPGFGRLLLLPPLDSTTILYNRFYWFRKFMLICRAKRGRDIHIEQQEAKILADAAGSYDRSIVEALAKLVDKEMAERSP